MNAEPHRRTSFAGLDLHEPWTARGLCTHHLDDGAERTSFAPCDLRWPSLGEHATLEAPPHGVTERRRQHYPRPRVLLRAEATQARPERRPHELHQGHAGDRAHQIAQAEVRDHRVARRAHEGLDRAPAERIDEQRFESDALREDQRREHEPRAGGRAVQEQQQAPQLDAIREQAAEEQEQQQR